MKAKASFELSADYYDLLYQDKNYAREVDFLEQIFKIYNKPKKILEVGSGTGNYTKILHNRGYEVTGLDISEPMVCVARNKCPCKFEVGDIRTAKIDGKFDACLAMFAVLGYLTNNDDLIQALKNIHGHLKPGGLLIFDVWNGLSVLRELPEIKVKQTENNKVKIVRIAFPTLKSQSHICEVDYKLLVFNKANETYRELDEKHVVRFYFPLELDFILKSTGFEVLKITEFLNLEGYANENVWNMTVIAKSVGSKS